MREYFRYFKWLYIIFAAVLLIFGLLTAGHAIAAGAAYYDRTNTKCTTTERVFDYGDVLTDKEEDKLRTLIDKRQKQTGCDIVLVTLNESLEEYTKAMNSNVSYDQFVKIYTEQFYDEHNFGYDKSDGDGIILVDNWYREDDGKIYTCLYTGGKVKAAYSDEEIDYLLDNVYRYVEGNPYRAYKVYANDFYHDMMGMNVVPVNIPRWITVAIGIISLVIFVACNWKAKRGKKTTVATTYVEAMEPHFDVRKDRFLRKSVVRHKMKSNSSGGNHGSGGGSSYSGSGVHSR